MKKYAVTLMMLLAMQSANAMENQQVVCLSDQKEKCLLVARYLNQYPLGKNEEESNKIKLFFKDKNSVQVKYVKKYMNALDKDDMDKTMGFIKSLPDKKFAQVYADSLNQPEIINKLTGSSCNTLILAAFSPDIFTALCMKNLPESFNDEGGFFDAQSHKGVQEEDPYGVGVFGVLGKKKEEEKVSTISREEMIKKLHEMPLGKAFYVFNYVTTVKPIKLSIKRECSVQDSAKFVLPSRIGCSKDLTYFPTFEDLQETPTPLFTLAVSIVNGSQAGAYNRHTRVKVTNDDIALLKEHLVEVNHTRKDSFLHNPLLAEAKIRVDTPPTTRFESIKNTFLNVVPCCFITLLPDFVHNNTRGFLQSAAGGFVCAFASSALGHYGYPILDSYNSEVGKLSEWYGANNHTSLKRGATFFWVSVINYCCVAMAQKLFSWGTTPWRIVGGTIHIVRMIPFDFCVGYLQKGSAPEERRNDIGLAYDFGDLLNGPKLKV